MILESQALTAISSPPIILVAPFKVIVLSGPATTPRAKKKPEAANSKTTKNGSFLRLCFCCFGISASWFIGESYVKVESR